MSETVAFPILFAFLASVFLIGVVSMGTLSENTRIDVITKPILDHVAVEGAVTEDVLSRVQVIAEANGIDFTQFDFSGSTEEPVEPGEIAVVRFTHTSIIDKTPLLSIGTTVPDITPREYLVVRMGR